jgi:hypothetical protein
VPGNYSIFNEQESLRAGPGTSSARRLSIIIHRIDSRALVQLSSHNEIQKFVVRSSDAVVYCLDVQASSRHRNEMKMEIEAVSRFRKRIYYSDPVEMVLEGPSADFQTHTTGAYRYSALAPTQSTAVGNVRSIMGHPGSRVWVQEIHVLKIGRYDEGFSGRTSATYQHQFDFPRKPSEDMDSKVTLRRHTTLRDVRYLYRAQVYSDDLQTLAKHHSMLVDRLRRHKCHKQPSFGPNEHVLSSWRLPTEDDDLTPLDINEDYGFSPFGQDFGQDFGFHPEESKAPWYLAPYVIKHGIVKFPTWDEVRAMGLLRTFEEVPS